MKTEMRRKMEQDVEAFQEQLYRDDDDEYWRQLEADRLRSQITAVRRATAV